MRTILFGGSVMYVGGAEEDYNDVWQYTAAAGWTQLAPIGTPPPPTGGARAVYDAMRDRMLLLISPTDVWSLTLSGTPVWSPLTPSGTPPTAMGACLYDPVRDRVLMTASEMWALSLSGPGPVLSWEPLGVVNPEHVRYETAVIYDSNRDRIVVLASPYGQDGHLWSLSLNGMLQWTEVAPVNGLPPNRQSATAVYDPIRDRMLRFGGKPDPYGSASGDTWAIAFEHGSATIEMGYVGTPGTHVSHVMVFDPDVDEVLIFGGAHAARFPDYLDTTYELPFGIRAEGVATAGGTVARNTNPPCDTPSSTVFFTATPAAGYTFTGWSGDASGTQNSLPVVVDDDKTIIGNFEQTPPLGGINLSWDDCGTHGLETKTFACNVNTGMPFTLVGSFKPPANVNELGSILAWFSIHSSTSSVPDWWKHGSGQCRGTFGLSASSDFTTGPFGCADLFAGQGGAGFYYDIGFPSPNRARLTVQTYVSGGNRVQLDPDVEYFSCRVSLSRSKSTGTSSCGGCAVPMTIVLDQLELFQSPEINYDPVLTLPLVRNVVRWQAPSTGVDDGTHTSFALAGAEWDPDGRGGNVTFTLPHSGPATLEVLDIAGRRWTRAVFDGLGAGRNEVRLDGPTPLGPGVYFLKLTQGQANVGQKLVIAR